MIGTAIILIYLPLAACMGGPAPSAFKALWSQEGTIGTVQIPRYIPMLQLLPEVVSESKEPRSGVVRRVWVESISLDRDESFGLSCQKEGD